MGKKGVGIRLGSFIWVFVSIMIVIGFVVAIFIYSDFFQAVPAQDAIIEPFLVDQDSISNISARDDISSAPNAKNP